MQWTNVDNDWNQKALIWRKKQNQEHFVPHFFSNLHFVNEQPTTKKLADLEGMHARK